METPSDYKKIWRASRAYSFWSIIQRKKEEMPERRNLTLLIIIRYTQSVTAARAKNQENYPSENMGTEVERRSDEWYKITQQEPTL